MSVVSKTRRLSLAASDRGNSGHGLPGRASSQRRHAICFSMAFKPITMVCSLSLLDYFRVKSRILKVFGGRPIFGSHKCAAMFVSDSLPRLDHLLFGVLVIYEIGHQVVGLVALSVFNRDERSRHVLSGEKM